MTPADLARARRHLRRADPILAEAMRRVGPCDMLARADSDLFEALVRAITSQQLSTKAADTIFGRVRSAAGDGTPGVPLRPRAVLEVPPERLRACGLSGRKVEYVHGLARAVEDGALPLDHLRSMSDEDAMAALTSVRGIGRWSAEMILIFRLLRSDVLPVDDVGILRAAQRLYRLRTRPTPRRLERLAEPWRPWRSVACWYLWATLDLPA
jgi:DNA-3-methyladenine glycosylase II